MASRYQLNKSNEKRINQLINIFDVSTSALINYLTEKALDQVEDLIPKISSELEKNPLVKESFKQVLKIRNRN